MSRPIRVRMMMVLAFALTLAAGLVAGVGLARQTVAQPAPPVISVTQPTTSPETRRDDWLVRELNLSASQRDAMRALRQDLPHEEIRKLDERRRAIWRERDEKLKKVVASYTPEQKAERDRIRSEYGARVSELVRQRDEELAAVNTDDQRAARDAALKEYAAKSAGLNEERDSLFKPMLDKVRLVLDEEQSKRFDAIMRGERMSDRGERNGERGGERDERAGHRGGPRPATSPSIGPGPSTGPDGPPPDGDFRRGGPGPRFGDEPDRNRPEPGQRRELGEPFEPGGKPPLDFNK